MWLPYTAIDQLLQALRESSASENSVVVGTGLPNTGMGDRVGWMRGQGGIPHDSCLSQLYEKLNDKMEDYQQKVSVATMERLYCRP